MPREAKPYIKGGWYVTSFGGVQHRKLCEVKDGYRQAELALARLQIAAEDAKSQPGVTPPAGPGIVPVIVQTAKSPTVQEAIDAFLDFKKAENAGATYDWYHEKLQAFYLMFGDRAMNSLTPEDGTRYKTYLRHEKEWKRGKGPVRKGLGTTTVNQHIRAAKTLIAWTCKPSLRQKYGMTLNPWEEIKQFKEKGRERIITKDEFNHMLNECKDGGTRGGARELRETLFAGRKTTMRPQELRHLRWEYLDYDNHRAVFPASVVKIRERREVTLLPGVEKLLKDRYERLTKLLGHKPRGYVFPLPAKIDGVTTAGAGEERMQKAAKFAQRIRRLIERCVKKGLIEKEKAGERIVPYSTRHTRITEQFHEGTPQHVVQHDAGHRNPKTTERYKHLSGSYVADDIRQRSKEDELPWDNGGSGAAS